MNIDEDYISGADIEREREYRRRKQREKYEKNNPPLAQEEEENEKEPESVPIHQEHQVSEDIYPLKNVEGHGYILDDTLDMLEIRDRHEKKYIIDCLVDFYDSDLYQYDFTSNDLVKFINEETFSVASSGGDSSVYIPEIALSDALKDCFSKLRYDLQGKNAIRVVIYMGSNFQRKKILLNNARRSIRMFLRQHYPSIKDCKVTIAYDANMWGSADLRVWCIVGELLDELTY